MRLANPWHRHLAHRRSQRRASIYRDLIRREAVIGGQLFGPIPEGTRREFVCLNKTTWLWHEEWADQHNIWHMTTTRYDIRPDGIYKMQNGAPARPIAPQEATHLRAAALLYNEQVQSALYNKSQHKNHPATKTTASRPMNQGDE